MSVLIIGMEMPNKKNGAVLIIYPDGKCACEDGKTYQAVPIPPHGRLIEADEFVKSLATLLRFPSNLVNGQWIVNTIRELPTVIPSDYLVKNTGKSRDSQKIEEDET